MKKSEMELLSSEEIYRISLQKNKKGNATSEALMAQEIIWERANCSYAHRIVYENNKIEEGDEVFLPEHYESKMNKRIEWHGVNDGSSKFRHN